ncbi:hypothetical protein [Aquipuribacter sp. SD81]|uniref:hypothetical protein n=1 Tax=Aquipuribacter sp. SD81 TaxID=3127703 RepID=UPI003016664B
MQDHTDRGTADGWDRLARAARPLTGADAAAIRRRALPWWAGRVAVPALVTALLVLEYVLSGDGPACTVDDPCLAAPGSSFVEGLQVGAAVALWLLPRVGAPVTALAALGYWAGIYLAVDGEPASVPALLCLGQAAVAGVSWAWQVRARRAPLPPRGPRVRLPADGRTRLVSTGLGTLEVAAVLAGLLAVGLAGWWVLADARTDARDARAEVVDVTVVSVDDVDWFAVVRVPGSGTVEVPLWDLEGVEPGARLPARVDASRDPVHVSLVSQPVEHDGWLWLSGVVATLALSLAAHRVGPLRRRARLLRHGGPVWSLTGGADDVLVVLPSLGLAAPFSRVLPTDGLLAATGLLHQELDEESASALEQDLAAEERADREDFAAAWRGEPRAHDADDLDDLDDLGGPHGDVLVLGDPRPGGVVVVVLPDAVVAPFAPLSALSPVLADGLDAGQAGHAGLAGPDGPVGVDLDLDPDGADLPGRPVEPAPVGVPLLGPHGRVGTVVLRQSPWRWLWAASALLLLVPWVLVTDWVWPGEPGDEVGWFEAVGVFAAGLAFGTGGLARARTRVVLDAAGVHVRDGYLWRSTQWWAVVGVRVADDDVLVALGLDDEGVPEVVGGAAPPGLRATAVAAAAERRRVDATLARGDAAGTGRPAPVGREAADRGLAAVAGMLAEADADRGRSRRLDPFLAGLAVVYVLAAASTLLAPVVL